jgi:GAF domain-containing protein
VDAALRLVTSLASETVEGADGVSVSLERHGRLQTVAATDDTILHMDHHQYETGEGPCVDAATKGRWFHSVALAEESRWPSFVPLAMGQGIASILSTPLVAADRPLGALNIYSRADHAFGSRQQELAALFAQQASGILADAGVDVSDQELAERISRALQSRQTIAHAQGVLMERDGIESDAASAVLIRAARAANKPLVEHAAEVVASARRRTPPPGTRR